MSNAMYTVCLSYLDYVAYCNVKENVLVLDLEVGQWMLCFYVCGFRIPSSSMKWRIYVGNDGAGFTCIG